MERAECLGNMPAGLWVISHASTYKADTESLFNSLQQDWNTHDFQVNCGKVANIWAIHNEIKKQIIMANVLRTNMKEKGIILVTHHIVFYSAADHKEKFYLNSFSYMAHLHHFLFEVYVIFP